MYIPKGEIGFKIYWNDMDGAKNYIFSNGTDKEQVVKDVIDYIRNRVYMASFTIVGLEQWNGKRWEKTDVKRQWCKGR